MPATNGTRNILVIGDIHVGSIYGLLPPDFVSSDGSEKPQNEGQKYLWECWQDMKRRTAKFAIDTVIVNGDLIEGKQPKQKCSELTLVAPNDQEAAAVFLMRDLRNWLEKNTGRGGPVLLHSRHGISRRPWSGRIGVDCGAREGSEHPVELHRTPVQGTA